jgi:hypothetical protein
MDPEQDQQIVRELADAFGELADVTPAADQPLHIVLKEVLLPRPWRPSPTRALVVFTGWPNRRPDFYIDMAVVGLSGEPPRSNSEQLVVGAAWRQFSFTFEWPQSAPTSVTAVQLWLTRFRETT